MENEVVEVYPHLIVSHDKGDATEHIPICFKLSADGCAECDDQGSLTQLVAEINEEFSVRRDDLDGWWPLKLCPPEKCHAFSSLEKYCEKKRLNKWDKIVFCSPILYAEASERTRSKHELSKLIFKFDLRKLGQHEKLLGFYNDFFSKDLQVSEKIDFYSNIDEAASHWIMAVIAAYNQNRAVEARIQTGSKTTYDCDISF